MSLPIVTPIPIAVGMREEGGDVCLGVNVAVLDLDLHRDMRWCANCGGEQVFLEVYEFESGRVGVCLGCGDERIARFTRTNSEAA